MSNPTLTAALSYIERGWSVVPLVPGTKRPAVELRPFLTGERRATVVECRQWWGDAGQRAVVDGPTLDPGYGIAIICGQPSGGLVVIDVDPRNGGDCEATARDCPTDYAVATGGGGLHLYVRGEGVVPKGKCGRPGVDRQGDGGYVVAPPSVHPDSGLAYYALRQGDPGALPAWALDGPGPRVSDGGGATGPWVAATLAAPESVEPGSQDETLTRLAWWAAGHLDEDIARSVLGVWATALPLSRPSEPWTVDHVDAKLRGAYAKRAAEFTVTTPHSDDAGAAGRGDSSGGGSSPAGLPAEVFQPLASLEFPEQRWVVEDFVAPGAFTEVIGKVKKGKSTLVYQMVRSLVEGSDFLGRKVESTPVVLLTEQAGGSLRATLERAGLQGNVVVVQKGGLARLGSWDQAIGHVVDHALWLGAKVIVVDTLSRLARLLGDAENRAGAVAVLDPFERARSMGIACVFVRHARKGAVGEPDDIADAARGSSAITGDMDIVIRLRPHGSEDVRILSWESRLTDDPEDLALRYVDGLYQVVDMPSSAAHAKADVKLAEMRAALDTCKTYDALQARLGWSRATIAKYKKMAEEGAELPTPPVTS